MPWAHNFIVVLGRLQSSQKATESCGGFLGLDSD